jgi:trans-2,3-dihydro-3-hydroxyanthranilate isomerase
MHDDVPGRTVSFAIVDVFADRPLEGNPVAVVHEAAGLSDTAMQRIAREFNQAETTFVFPSTRHDADWRLRSFTTAAKEAFGVGHHTLGAWWWLAESGALSLSDTGGRFAQEIGDRLLAVTVRCESGSPVAVGMSQTSPEFGPEADDLSQLAVALGLPMHALARHDLPAQVVSTGVPHLLVPLQDRTAVNAAQPDLPRLGSLLHMLGGEGCYIFALDPVRPECIAHTRFFNPTLGIAEDIATGTAAGPLACQLVARGLAPDGSTLRIEQGDSLGRPSVIEVHVSAKAVTLSGRCVVSGTGRLRVD